MYAQVNTAATWRHRGPLGHNLKPGYSLIMMKLVATLVKLTRCSAELCITWESFNRCNDNGSSLILHDKALTDEMIINKAFLLELHAHTTSYLHAAKIYFTIR